MNRTLALVHEYDTPGSSMIAFSLARDRYIDSSSSVSVYHSLWNDQRVVVVLTNDPTLPLVLAGGRRIEPPVDLVNLLIARHNITAGQGKPRDHHYEDGLSIFSDGTRGN